MLSWENLPYIVAFLCLLLAAPHLVKKRWKKAMIILCISVGVIVGDKFILARIENSIDATQEEVAGLKRRVNLQSISLQKEIDAAKKNIASLHETVRQLTEGRESPKSPSQAQ